MNIISTRESEILKAFDDYCRTSGLSASTVGQRICNDHRMYKRLSGGGSITLNTYIKVMGWFERNMPRVKVE